MNNHQKNFIPPANLDPNELKKYLIQQGFFQDEVSLPTEDTPQMDDLVVCARNYLRDKRLNHGRNPMVYLEAITYCILHRSYTELDDPQKKAITNFAELIAHQV